MKSTFRYLSLAGIVCVAMVETIVASRSYRDTLTQQDWLALATMVRGLPDGEPVLVATTWLEPRVRMHIAAAARIEWVARPDLRGMRRFHVIGYDDAWSTALTQDLEGTTRPRLVAQQGHGPLRLSTYAAPASDEILDTFDARDIAIKDEPDGCKGPACRWARVRYEVVEVDYRPRQCLALRTHDDTTLQIKRKAMRTGDRIVGHVGFGDFNARLRNDAPVRITVTIDGTTALQILATDAEGWKPFSMTTTPGIHEVAVTADIFVGGTWQGLAYNPGAARVLCLELRTMKTTDTPEIR